MNLIIVQRCRGCDDHRVNIGRAYQIIGPDDMIYTAGYRGVHRIDPDTGVMVELGTLPNFDTPINAAECFQCSSDMAVLQTASMESE